MHNPRENASTHRQPTLRMMPGEALLLEALHKFTDVVVSVRTLSGWQTRRSQFLGHDQARKHLVLAPLVHHVDGAPIEFAPGQQVGVTFRIGHKKCMFGTPFLRHGSFHDGDQTWPDALWLEWPEQLQHFQRRVYYRVTAPAHRPIPVAIECTSGGASQSGAMMQTQLEDVSVGGIRVRSKDARSFTPGENVRIAFHPTRASGELVLDATFRHQDAGDDGTFGLGFQFVGLETSADGRQNLIRLARAVTELGNKQRQGGLPGRGSD